MGELRITLELLQKEAEQKLRDEQLAEMAGSLGRALARWNDDHPTFQLVKVVKNYGNDRFDVERPGGGLRRWVKGIIPGMSKWLLVGMWAIMGHYDRDKQDPYLKSLAGNYIGEAATAIWLAFGQSFDRRHGVLGDYADTPLTAAEILNNPVHFRYGTAGLYVWSSFQSEVEEEEDPPDNWGKITAPDGSKSTDKIWHDLLISEVAAGETGVDLVVGLISEAKEVILNDGSPTGPAWTEDQACLVALDAETLEEKWRTCLEPFDFEIEDDGGIDIGF